MKALSLRLFPSTHRDWIQLAWTASLTLMIAMIAKEWPIYERSGGREGFHWSYEVLTMIATLSLLKSSVSLLRYSFLFPIIGILSSFVGLAWTFMRPVY